MNRDKLYCLAASAFVAITPALALAADDAHAGDDHGGKAHAAPGPIPSLLEGYAPAITAIVVFSIVVLLLMTMVWPKILKGLNERADKIESEIEAAEDARRQAKEALEQYEASLAEARAEAKAMLDQTRAEQKKLADELKAKNDAELSQMREKALSEITTARKAAVAELYAESAQLAAVMATKILGREVNAGDQQQLVEESLRELEARRN